MAFVRKRGNSHQLIETYREGGKVKQRVVARLGAHSTPEPALAELRAQRRQWAKNVAKGRHPWAPGEALEGFEDLYKQELSDLNRRIEQLESVVSG